MKFLLIRPGKVEEGAKHNFSGLLYAPASFPPLGLLYVAASLEEEGHKAEIFDFYIDAFAEEKTLKILDSVDAVGMSVYTADLKDAKNISKKIKEIKPNIPMIIGGPHCIYLQKKSLMDIPYSDIVVGCEGEEVIKDVARWLEGTKELADIRGIHFRYNGRIKQGKPHEIIDDLDSIAFPARHNVDKYEYGDLGGWGYVYKKKVTSILSSRGCPFKCRFCARYGNVIKGWGYRKRSAENVVEELQTLDGKYRSIQIADDNFLADIRRAHKIFDMILDIGLDFNFHIAGARVENADLGLYKKMKKAGVKEISYGIESGNQDVLDFYSKGITLNQIKKAVSYAKKVGFISYATFILGAPIETKKHLENTIDFACSLPLDIALFTSLRYEMGSALWFEAVKDNIISENDIYTLADSNRNLGNLSRDELRKYVVLGHKRFYYRPRYIANEVFKTLVRGDLNMLLYGLSLQTRFMK